MFPLAKIPHERFDQGMRRFGASRAGGSRKHAGCDLYAPPNTPILAVADGLVTGFAAFYEGTFALVVDHDDFIVRYGETKGKLPSGVAIGEPVTKGQIIAYVGYMKRIKMSMIHFEMYSGEQKGPLTVRSNKGFQRRSDLLDPTPFLKKWELEKIISGQSYANTGVLV